MPTLSRTTSYLDTVTIWDGWITTGTIASTSTSNIYQTWIADWQTNSVTAVRRSVTTPISTWNLWIDEVDDVTQATIDVTEAYIKVRRQAQAKPHDAHITAYLKHQEVVRAKRAERRALATMLRNLTKQQREYFRDFGYFPVVGPSGQVYRIRKGRVANIDVMEKGGVKHRLCAHPGIHLPVYDVMLAQALHLSANEDYFLSVANVHHGPGLNVRPDGTVAGTYYAAADAA